MSAINDLRDDLLEYKKKVENMVNHLNQLNYDDLEFLLGFAPDLLVSVLALKELNDSKNIHLGK